MLKWLPILWSNLTRRRLRTILTMVSVMASFLLFGLLESFRFAVNTFADDYSNALVVQSRNVPLPISHVTSLKQRRGITSACGVLLAPADVSTNKRIYVQGISPLGLFAAHPGIVLSQPSREAWDRERVAALIDQNLASENGWKLGDRVMVRGAKDQIEFRRFDGVNALEVVIAGIYATDNELSANGMFVHDDYLRDVVGSEKSGFEYIVVRFADDTDVDHLRSRIDDEFRNSSAPTKTYSYRALLRASYGTFRELSRLALIVVSVSFITLLLIVGSVLAQAQQQRQREFAVMQAFGTPRGVLAGLIVGEAFSIIVPPAFVGLLTAGFLARAIDTGVMVAPLGILPPHTFAIAALLVIALSVAIAIAPCRQMLHVAVANNLSRE